MPFLEVTKQIIQIISSYCSAHFGCQRAKSGSTENDSNNVVGD